MNLFMMRAWLRARYAPTDNERGANMVEYVLLLAFIALVVIGVVTLLGGTISSKFSSANNALQG